MYGFVGVVDSLSWSIFRYLPNSSRSGRFAKTDFFDAKACEKPALWCMDIRQWAGIQTTGASPTTTTSWSAPVVHGSLERFPKDTVTKSWTPLSLSNISLVSARLTSAALSVTNCYSSDGLLLRSGRSAVAWRKAAQTVSDWDRL